MRILHVVPTYLPATRYGGPIYSVHGLCAGLARLGHEVHVYTTNVDGTSVSPVPLGAPVDRDGVKVTYFRTGHGRRLYRSPSMHGAFERNVANFDLVHLHSVFLWPTAAGAAAARSANVPYILSPRGMLVPELIRHKSWLLKSAWILLIEGRNLAMAKAVHVTSEREAYDLERLGLHSQRIAVIPNGIELPSIFLNSAAIGSANTRRKSTVLSLGRISWKKGLDRLIPAMVHIEDAELTIAGNDDEGLEPQLRKLAQEWGVADRTHFIGPVNGAEKWRTLASADIFALPSYSENFGMAVLEAMAMGLPVVVTPEVGLASTVAETGAGLVIAGNADSFGRALAQLIADPGLRQRMGEAGRRTAADRFSWAVVSKQIEALYRDLARPVQLRGSPVRSG